MRSTIVVRSFIIVAIVSITAVLNTGCGAAADSVAPPPPPPVGQLSANPASMDFGSVTVGSSSTQSVAVTNTGDANLTISQIATTGAAFNGSGIAIPAVLTPGQSAIYAVRFAPSSTAAASGQVTFTSNASNSTVSVPLSGTGTAAPIAQLTATPTSIAFGNVIVSTTNTQTVTITNTGNASLTISQIATTGTGFSGSGITVPLPLSPGQSAAYNVRYAPLTANSVSGQVTFTSNASNTTLTVPLGGTGTAPPAGQLTATPTSINFGNVTVGANNTQTVTISNTGTASLTISQVTTTGTGFSGSGITVPLSLLPGQNAAYTVRFAPLSVGSVTGQLAVVSTASSTPVVITLTGNAVAAPIGQLTPSATSINFGNITVSSTATRSLTVTNTGNAGLTISEINTTGASFSVSASTLPLALSPGQSATYVLQFAPTATGAVIGQVSFTSNGSNSPTLVSLSGSGTSAPTSLSPAPASLVFGDVLVGNTKSLSGTLTASGGSVTLSSLSVTNSRYSVTGLPLPLTLTAGQVVPFSVTFAPTAAGSASGQVNFVSNASNSPAAVSVSGSGGVVPHSVDLTWDPSTSADITGYRVYRGTRTGGPYTLLTGTLLSGTSYTDSSVQSGTTYFFVITAINNSSVESAFSAEAQAVIPLP